jgi:hypothetical protein
MDNCKLHVLDSVQKGLGQSGVVSVTNAPHTIVIFQILDLSLFGVFKILRNRIEDIESQVDVAVRIVEIIRMIEETCTVPRVQDAFKRDGFRASASVEPARIQFGEA